MTSRRRKFFAIPSLPGGEEGDSFGEELASTLTHFAGATLSVAAVGFLLNRTISEGDGWRLFSFSVYGSSMILVYLVSTVYHLLSSPQAKNLFRTLDHICIFFMIAGSYTPFLLVNLRHNIGWKFFFLVWGIALAGSAMKIFWTGRHEIVSTILYLGMGWMALFAIGPMLESIPVGGIAWIVAGGLSYTGGVAFFAWEGLRYNHAIWHLFVLTGSACHYFAILFYVLPRA